MLEHKMRGQIATPVIKICKLVRGKIESGYEEVLGRFVCVADATLCCGCTFAFAINC